jgi:hypothetical protein
MNRLFEAKLAGGDSFWILAPNHYRADELLAAFLESNRLAHYQTERKYSIAPVDMEDERVLTRGPQCRECET